MHSFTLQELVCVRGGTGQSSITQDEPGWLDLADYHDVVIWANFTSFSGAPSLLIQTSPTKDEFFFQTIATITPALGTSVSQVLLWSATIPLARYVRWQLTGTPTYDATFRVAVAANAEGLGA